MKGIRYKTEEKVEKLRIIPRICEYKFVCDQFYKVLSGEREV